MSKQRVATGFLIFRRLSSSLEYLTLQTSYGEHHWTPPKGHVDPGESEWETAVRETKEEAGLDISQLRVYEDFKRELNYEVKGHPKRVVYWLAELRNPDTAVVLSHEHRYMKWCQIDEVCKLSKYNDLQNLYREAHQYLSSSTSS